MPQSWFRCSHEPIFFHVPQGRCNTATVVTPHVSSEKFCMAAAKRSQLTTRKISHWTSDRSKIDTCLGIREWHIQQGRENHWWKTSECREFILADEKTLKSQPKNYCIVVRIRKKITLYYKSITRPFKHIESFSENMPSSKFLSYGILFFLILYFNFPHHVSCYLSSF